MSIIIDLLLPERLSTVVVLLNFLFLYETNYEL